MNMLEFLSFLKIFVCNLFSLEIGKIGGNCRTHKKRNCKSYKMSIWKRLSESEHALPIALVRKKTGGLRMYIEYGMLNKITLKGNYPIPSNR